MESPTAQVVTGPGYGLDDYTFGAMLANELLSWLAIVVALMSIFLVVRHTRTEEETGRSELVRASVVGHHAMTCAARPDGPAWLPDSCAMLLRCATARDHEHSECRVDAE